MLLRLPNTCFFILSPPLGESPFRSLKSKRSVLQKRNKRNGESVICMWLELSHCSDEGEHCCPFLGICVHFADSGGLNLPVCQVPTLPCSVSLLNRTWGVNQVEELIGQDKNREITHQLPSQKNQIWPQNDSVNLLPVNSRMRLWEIKILKIFLPLHFSQAQLHPWLLCVQHRDSSWSLRNSLTSESLLKANHSACSKSH